MLLDNCVYSDACKDRGWIARCELREGSHVPPGTNAANAAFIVRAANCHDDLLAACEAAEFAANHIDCVRAMQEALPAIRAAIAKATRARA